MLGKSGLSGGAAYKVGRMQLLWAGAYAWGASDSLRVLKVTPTQPPVLRARLGGNCVCVPSSSVPHGGNMFGHFSPGEVTQEYP